MIKYLGNLTQDSLKNEVVIVTGAGRGIGYETARALLWLGANVIIAEINEKNGKTAVNNLENEYGAQRVLFVKTDVRNEKDIEKLEKETMRKFYKVDAIINNATLVSGIMGPVKDSPIESWDQSYYVNLRGPVLLAKKFLPGMIKRKHGTFICISSSGAAPYMGPYEVMKTAQVELANTLAPEVEDNGIHVFTIGPGIVRTPGFMEGGAQVAKYMDITPEELIEMNKAHELPVEAAGAGFAAALTLASKYHGQETSSIQILREIGVDLKEKGENEKVIQILESKIESRSIENYDLLNLYKKIQKTFNEQSDGWKSRNLFERQWIYRDFKKSTQISVDQMKASLDSYGEELNNLNKRSDFIEIIKKLMEFYEHQQKLYKDFEKSQEKLQENLSIMDRWILECKSLINLLKDYT
ncbi:MAG: SDR family NAD(P)-dependent oxidoreductase [Candidatus Thorarchaeota archaeon]